MKCPSCKSIMQIRNGMHGEFYFCPQQHICKQRTITKNKPAQSTDGHPFQDKLLSTYDEYYGLSYQSPSREVRPSGAGWNNSDSCDRRTRSCNCGQNLFGIGIDYCKACGTCAR